MHQGAAVAEVRGVSPRFSQRTEVVLVLTFTEMISSFFFYRARSYECGSVAAAGLEDTKTTQAWTLLERRQFTQFSTSSHSLLARAKWT